MKKKLVIEYWIDEDRVEEDNKILNNISVNGAYFSSKDGKQIIDVIVKRL